MAALVQREVIALRIDALLGDVDTLINHLNRIDGDPDLEPEEDFGADDVGENRTWPEGVNQSRIGQHATAQATLEDDAEDDDPREDDNQDRCVCDGPHDGGEDYEREQMQCDVPCFPVYAIEPNPFNGRREKLGYSGNNLASFVGLRGMDEA